MLTIVIAALIIFFILYTYLTRHKQRASKFQTRTIQPSQKPVIVLIIDSLMDKPLQKIVKEGQAPALKFFLENGKYYPDMVSAYPTMSVTVDSTLLTGTYPDRHHIPGLLWYDGGENRVVGYGSGIKEILVLGLKNVLHDSICYLNDRHLNQSVKTLHETLSEQGKQTASINGLIYRANIQHALNVPKIAALFKLLPDKLKAKGPDLFSFGRLAKIDLTHQLDHFFQKFGLNDKFTAKELKYLIQQDKQPSLTIAYFPDHDKTVHKNGPMDLKGIRKADKQLQKILNAYDTWNDALKHAVWVVMGDSGQSAVSRNKNHSRIQLNALLRDYQISKSVKPPNINDEIVIVVNERMAYIYSLDETITLIEIASKLKKDERIDLISWKEGGTVHVVKGGTNQSLKFRRNGRYIDQYNQSWSLDGDFTVLDLLIDNNNISYGDYPDALARLHAALHSHKGRFLVVDAKPGYELAGEDSPSHAGGAAHGSLHRKDSAAPMIVVGTDKAPEHLRHVDLKDYLLQLIKDDH
ncbi:alkaline phosphatase family protein [Scopulibacillus daqui]|nr:alkaline phosphatase family protein [Scopulibacillus daqui]